MRQIRYLFEIKKMENKNIFNKLEWFCFFSISFKII